MSHSYINVKVISLIETINFSTEELQERLQLQHLNIYKSTEQDMFHLRILQALNLLDLSQTFLIIQ